MSFNSKEVLRFQKVLEGMKKLPRPLEGELATKKVEQRLEELGKAIERVEALRKDLAKALNERNRLYEEVRTLISRVRSSVRGLYGPDSDEYELVGGTRTSERRRPRRRVSEDSGN